MQKRISVNAFFSKITFYIPCNRILMPFDFQYLKFRSHIYLSQFKAVSGRTTISTAVGCLSNRSSVRAVHKWVFHSHYILIEQRINLTAISRPLNVKRYIYPCECFSREVPLESYWTAKGRMKWKIIDTYLLMSHQHLLILACRDAPLCLNLYRL